MIPLALLTDFGLADHYVGVMHAVLVSKAPDSPRFNLGHDIPRGDVWAGAVALRFAWHWLPQPCIVVAVVDPGVGTDRRAVALRFGARWLVGPDNGLLMACGGPDEAFEIDAERLSDRRPSGTFHGRDVFAPAAARLACRHTVDSFAGSLEVGSLCSSPLPEPVRTASGWSGVVLSVDVFGNVVTNIPVEEIRGGAGVSWSGGSTDTRVRTYGEAGGSEVVWLEGSSGLLELAVNGGSAAVVTGLERRDQIVVRDGDRGRDRD